MLNRPRSSLPTTRRIKASRFSARSSGGMSLVPILALDHEVRGVPRLQGELSRREDADADRLPASFRQDDVLFDAILRDRKINIAKVHGDLDGLFERTGLGGLEQLLDGLDRMLVRRGRSPPAVRAARWPPAEERRGKS